MSPEANAMLNTEILKTLPQYQLEIQSARLPPVHHAGNAS